MNTRNAIIEAAISGQELPVVKNITKEVEIEETPVLEETFSPVVISEPVATEAEVLVNSAFEGLEGVKDNNIEAVAGLLDRFGLRWDVEKLPLLAGGNIPTKYFGITRMDTKEVFYAASDEYVPFQNSSLAELIIRIADKTGYEVHNGGFLNGGAKVYLQLNTMNEIKGLGENGTTVKGFATALNTHDGTLGIKWGATNLTICCQNTFAAAGSKLANKARHSRTMHDKIEASIQEILALNEVEKKLFGKFLQLSEIAIKPEHLKSVILGITGVDISMTIGEQEDKFSTRSINKTADILNAISHETSYKGETLWGLFSGITYYTSHIMNAPKRDNGRFETKLVGSAYNIDNQAFENIINLVGIN